MRVVLSLSYITHVRAKNNAVAKMVEIRTAGTSQQPQRHPSEVQDRRLYFWEYFRVASFTTTD